MFTSITHPLIHLTLRFPAYHHRTVPCAVVCVLCVALRVIVLSGRVRRHVKWGKVEYFTGICICCVVWCICVCQATPPLDSTRRDSTQVTALSALGEREITCVCAWWLAPFRICMGRLLWRICKVAVCKFNTELKVVHTRRVTRFVYASSSHTHTHIQHTPHQRHDKVQSKPNNQTNPLESNIVLCQCIEFPVHFCLCNCSHCVLFVRYVCCW